MHLRRSFARFKTGPILKSMCCSFPFLLTAQTWSFQRASQRALGTAEKGCHKLALARSKTLYRKCPVRCRKCP